jgi:protoheme IX farnesyltransferase
MLTKPGIMMGNAVTTAAGFALASKGDINIWLFLATLVGLSFVIASAGVFNNYIDRASDAKMARTKDRPLVTGLISNQKALIFGTVLGLIGAEILATFTNYLTVGIALIGFFVYLVLYAFLKYRSFYGTLMGSVAGAVPPVVGYCAVSNRLDLAALLLFLILVLWQMPHFFAIAIYRFDDYQAASIPVLPVKKGMFVTKVHMFFYIIAFTLTSSLLTLAGYTGKAYFVVAILLGLAWLGLCFKGFTIENNGRWAHKMFSLSLVVIMVLCLTITFDVIK